MIHPQTELDTKYRNWKGVRKQLTVYRRAPIAWLNQREQYMYQSVYIWGIPI